MSYQTFGDLKNLARYLLGEAGSDPRAMTWIGTAINAAYAEYCGSYPWHCRQSITETTYPAENECISVADYGIVQGVCRVGGGFLDYMPPLILLSRRERLGDARGIPKAWSVYSSGLFLFPKPPSDIQIKILHLGDITPLVNESDEPVIPLLQRPLIVYRALSIMLAAESPEGSAAARMYQDAYVRGMRAAKMQEPGGALYKTFQDMAEWPTSGTAY